jgi:ABC-type polar amino acid transport system ATPase subunit
MVVYAGKGRGFDMSLLSAYQQFADDLAEILVDIHVVYWIISHSRNLEKGKGGVGTMTSAGGSGKGTLMICLWRMQRKQRGTLQGK